MKVTPKGLTLIAKQVPLKGGKDTDPEFPPDVLSFINFLDRYLTSKGWGFETDSEVVICIDEKGIALKPGDWLVVVKTTGKIYGAYTNEEFEKYFKQI